MAVRLGVGPIPPTPICGSGDNRLWFDDIGIITGVATFPEPAKAMLALPGLILLSRRRRQAAV